MADYDAIVIGAGCGGLTAGALLAHQGRKVLVLEQNERIGGCCSTFERDGFRFDVGASIVEVLKPMELVFQKLGTTLQKEVDLIPCDPIMSIVARDGSRITYPLSVEETGRIIAEISPEQLTVRFSDELSVDYAKNELSELQPAYAMSVHKSQGSEYPVVILPLVPGHRVMLQRNLLYTAITRARERVILLGSQAALRTAVENDRTKKRCTLLAERLNHALE